MYLCSHSMQMSVYVQAADSEKGIRASNVRTTACQSHCWLAAICLCLTAQLMYLLQVQLLSSGITKLLDMLHLYLCSKPSVSSKLVLLSAFSFAIPALSARLTAWDRPAVNKHCLKTSALALAAAEGCVLLCVDWACVFIVLIVTVPMLLLQPFLCLEQFTVCAVPLHCVCCLLLGVGQTI